MQIRAQADLAQIQVELPLFQPVFILGKRQLGHGHRDTRPGHLLRDKISGVFPERVPLRNEQLEG